MTCVVLFLLIFSSTPMVYAQSSHPPANTDSDDCSILPCGPNKCDPYGCPGAAWINGNPSQTYCQNGDGRFPWFALCCQWSAGQCRHLGCGGRKTARARRTCGSNINEQESVVSRPDTSHMDRHRSIALCHHHHLQANRIKHCRGPRHHRPPVAECHCGRFERSTTDRQFAPRMATTDREFAPRS